MEKSVYQLRKIGNDLIILGFQMFLTHLVEKEFLFNTTICKFHKFVSGTFNILQRRPQPASTSSKWAGRLLLQNVVEEVPSYSYQNTKKVTISKYLFEVSQLLLQNVVEEYVSCIFRGVAA